MSNSHLFPYMYKGDLLTGKTFDEYRTTGVYGIRIASNVPSDSPVNTSSLYGVLVVHVAPFVAQIAYLNNGNAYYRMYTNESWSVWGQLC